MLLGSLLILLFHFGPIDEGYRQFVEWIADMYAKGYIDPEIVTMTNDIYQSKVAQDLVGSLRGPLGGNFGSFNSTMPEKIPGFHVMGTVPPVGPDGKYIHTSIDQMPRGIAGAAITSKCENVDRAIEWIDWMYSAEGALYVWEHLSSSITAYLPFTHHPPTSGL